MGATNLLLVEGQDDMHFFIHLLKRHNLLISEPRRDEAGRIRLVESNGLESLLNKLPVWLKGSDIERLGVVIDADTNLAGRWASLLHTFASSGYRNLPQEPSADGTIIFDGDRPTVGIWLMPHNTIPGMLEDFARLLVPPDDPLWPRLGPCLALIPDAERRWKPGHTAKVQLHTWLAWQEEPGTPIGQAITKRYLDANAPSAQLLISWVRRLFLQAAP